MGKLKLAFDNIEIEVTKKYIKNIYLSVHPPNGAVKISAPIGLKDEDIKQFAISKLSWIRKQKSKFKNQKRFVENKFISGEPHYFLGTEYSLNVIYQASNRSKVEITNQKFINLYVNQNSSKEKREKVLREWYREELKKLIPPLLKKWEEKIGVHTEDWRIKQMKTRWGTCNIMDKRIWINLELVKKPLRCLEYIIVHELVHLIEKNHGKRFIALMDKYYPDWRKVKSELNAPM